MARPLGEESTALTECQGFGNTLPQGLVFLGPDDLLQPRRPHHFEAQHGGYEGQVLHAPRYQFTKSQIVRLETPADRSTSIVVAEPNQAVLPAFWQRGGVWGNAIGEVAEGLVELRIPSKAALNVFRQFR